MNHGIHSRRSSESLTWVVVFVSHDTNERRRQNSSSLFSSSPLFLSKIPNSTSNFYALLTSAVKSKTEIIAEITFYIPGEDDVELPLKMRQDKKGMMMRVEFLLC
jgi:hypothetical protein